MNNVYKIQREWYITNGTGKFNDWTAINSGFYRYISDNHAVHNSETSTEIFNNFDELYKAAKDYPNIIADITPIAKKRKITFSGHWYLGQDFVIIEGKHDKCFPIKTRFISKTDNDVNTIKELANLLPAEDFCQYLVDHGLGGKDLGNLT